MEFRSLDLNYLNAAADLAVENYYNEQREVTALYCEKYKDELLKLLNMLFEKQLGVMAINDFKTINVGDLFVAQSYRGQNVAQELIQFTSDALENEGYKRLWVEHGMTNPNAQRFWNKYFTSFTYTMTRQIDERIFELYTL